MVTARHRRPVPLSPADHLAAAGGVLTTGDLVALVGRHRLRHAVRRGEVVRLRRGRSGVPAMGDPLALAVGAGGCLSHVSAAVHHGWGVLRSWDVTCVTLRRGRHPGAGPAVRWSYAELDDAELAAGVTDPVRTVLDCARTLPLAQALAVADSALRSGDVHRDNLLAAAASSRSPGVVRARRVVREADERAANPFESALRAVVLDAGITGFVPQLVVAEEGLFACVDLGDPGRRVALEADGFAVHGDRRSFAKDLARHDELQSAGWVTRRFAFEHVVQRPAWAGEQVRAAVGQRLTSQPVRHKAHPGRGS